MKPARNAPNRGLAGSMNPLCTTIMSPSPHSCTTRTPRESVNVALYPMSFFHPGFPQGMRRFDRLGVVLPAGLRGRRGGPGVRP